MNRNVCSFAKKKGFIFLSQGRSTNLVEKMSTCATSSLLQFCSVSFWFQVVAWPVNIWSNIEFSGRMHSDESYSRNTVLGVKPFEACDEGIWKITTPEADQGDEKKSPPPPPFLLKRLIKR